jgi:hypothetical protein
MGQTEAAVFEAAAKQVRVAKQHVRDGEPETAKTALLETYEARDQRDRRSAPPDKAVHQTLSKAVYGLDGGTHDDVQEALDELHELYTTAAERSRDASDR